MATTMRRIIRSLGNEGARANALDEALRAARDAATVAALARHLAPLAARPARAA